MVFTRLSPQEKEAFFGLLDEYFQSRPEIFGQGGTGQGGLAGTGISAGAAASVVQRAITTPRSNNPYAASLTHLDVGRVAAASRALSGHAGAASQSQPDASEVDKLVTRKSSVLSAFGKKQPGTVAIPSAFGVPKNTFGPPPVRRAVSETTGGAWAEVLYDYSSEDAGDLAIEAGTRVLVTDKSSEDWWTGKVEGQGKEGLFPATYVKLL